MLGFPMYFKCFWRPRFLRQGVRFFVRCDLKTQRFFGGGGEAFLLTVGAFLLTVEVLCLQSLKALIRRTFPL